MSQWTVPWCVSSHPCVPHGPVVTSVEVWDDAQSWGLIVGPPKAGTMVVGQVTVGDCPQSVSHLCPSLSHGVSDLGGSQQRCSGVMV